MRRGSTVFRSSYASCDSASPNWPVCGSLRNSSDWTALDSSSDLSVSVLPMMPRRQKGGTPLCTAYIEHSWGHSSAGRAPALQAGGHRFDPGWLHWMKLLQIGRF
jgi:hypothetical protein